jgi:hypothetical protein
MVRASFGEPAQKLSPLGKLWRCAAVQFQMPGLARYTEDELGDVDVRLEPGDAGVAALARLAGRYRLRERDCEPQITVV